MMDTTKCAACGVAFANDNRVALNRRETFVFKPADVEDVKTFVPDDKGGQREVSTAAILSPEALRESRKEHQRTVVATVFQTFGRMPFPEGAFNVRHATCGNVRMTASAPGAARPWMKHEIRFQRSAVK